jgi:hypothetical protein
MLGPKQKKLIEQFAADLMAVRTFAEAWWRDLLDREEQATGSLTAALAAIKLRWPAGPVTHPRVIAVVRQYYFSAERLNSQIAAERKDETEILELSQADVDELIDEEVAPSTLLKEGLETSKWGDLSDFLSALPYWPIGMDGAGALI